MKYLTHAKEILTWINADSELPDCDTTILMFAPGHLEPVWPGYLDEDGGWRFANGAAMDHEVIAWAELPSGPGKND